MSGNGDGGDIGTANTMRERAGESRLKIWLLLAANRLLVTAALALIVFVVFVVAVTVLPQSLLAQVRSADTIETMFSTMIGAIITGTTLVVTIGQLVISQENGPLGEQRDRMENTMDVRDYTEEVIGAPTPADPSAFLAELVDAARLRAVALQESVAETDDAALREEVEEFTDSLVENAETVGDELEDATFGSFDVLFAALDFNYGWKIFQIERMGTDHAESIDAETDDRLSELRTALSLFGPAREHIKTLYFEWELVSLSQMILYAAVPALLVAGVMLAVVDAGTAPGTTLGVANVTWIVGAAFTITLLPFLLFTSYVLRIVTVAKRTLAIGPLILRDSGR